MTDYPPRPTEDTGPPQWSQADLDLAVANKQDDLIVAAKNAGQLAELMRTANPAASVKSKVWTSRDPKPTDPNPLRFEK